MADDPNRDILPVKDDSFCVDTCRSSIDPRERHLVYKLDRYELEDKYLRLFEEANKLKKLSNCQEDKIKRLATKLMRVTANPRACSVALDMYDDKKKIIALELENSKLKDKISVLRNQLLSHTITSRSSSRSRNPQTRPSSGRITCRSENSRTKIPSCHCIIRDGNDDDERSGFVKIEELEAQNKKMACRILQLEKELSVCTTTNQREKIAENVEYIRVWRQMKQLNDKLIAAESTNNSLNAQINDLKMKLEETTKDNKDISAALLTEKKRVAEVDEQMLKAKGSQLSLREKDEQIKDLMNEVKILQQHNNELVALSSKYSEVETENTELKRRVTEQQHDQETLRTAVNTEQANIVALQTSNEQLLGKLEELQKNMDTLTVQLTSFQTQTERQETSRATQISTKQPDKENSIEVDNVESRESTAMQVVRCKKCCDEYEKILHLEETVYVTAEANRLTNTSVQTEHVIQLSTGMMKDQGTSVMTPVKQKPKDEELVLQQIAEPARPENPLTPEKMLTLLEQAQISTPLNAARFPHKVDNNDYNGILDLNQRHSDTETVTQAPQDIPIFTPMYQQQKSDKSSNLDQPMDTQLTSFSKMLSFLFDIFRGCPPECVKSPEANLYRPKSTIEHLGIFTKDINNNIGVEGSQVTKKSTFGPSEVPSSKDQHVANRLLGTDISNENNKVPKAVASYMRSGCSNRKYCSNVYNRARQEKLKRNILLSGRRRDQVMKFANSGDCTCDDLMSCRFNSACEHGCCNNNSEEPFLTNASNNKTSQYDVSRATSNTSRDVDCSIESDLFKPSVQNYTQTNGTMYMTRKLQDEGVRGPYRPPERNRMPERKNAASYDSKSLHEYVKHLDKCRELLNNSCSLNSVTQISVKETVDQAANANQDKYRWNKEQRMAQTRNIESFCSLNCPNECVDAANAAPDSFPLVIMDGQGLMELHIVSLQLSTSAKQILFQENDIANVSLFISWNIWNQETTCTPRLNCPKLNFNSSFVYRISDLFSFFNYVLLEFVQFQVNVYREDCNNYTVATGKLSIKDMLDYPQNKLHYIAPVNSVLPCSLGANFGQLSLWVRLSCDVEKVEDFKKKRGLQLQTEFSQESSMEPSSELISRLSSTIPGKSVQISTMDSLAFPASEETAEISFTEPPAEAVIPEPKLEKAFISSDESVSSEVKEVLVQELSSLEKSRKQSSEYNFEHYASNTTRRSSGTSNDMPNSEDRFSNNDHHLTVVKGSQKNLHDSENDTSDTRILSIGESVEAAKESIRTKSEEMSNSSANAGAAKHAEKKDDKARSHPETLSVKEFNAVITDTDGTTAHGDSDESIQEVSNVFSQKNWDEYRRRSILSFANAQGSLTGDTEQSDEQKATNDDNLLQKDTIVIEILSMILLPKNSIMTNDEIQLLYIEFSFLGYSGADMETVSLRKPTPPEQKLTYNFRKKFRVDPRRNSMQDNILRSMLHDSGSPNIKFIVVSEPLPEDTDTKECEEVGYALFDIRNHALVGTDNVVSLQIFAPNGAEQIGFLKISVSGVETIRQRLARRSSSIY